MPKKKKPEHKIPLAIVLKPVGVFTVEDGYRWKEHDYSIYLHNVGRGERTWDTLYHIQSEYVGTLLDNTLPVVVFNRTDIYDTDEEEEKD